MYTVTLIPGDGVGAELCACVGRVFHHLAVPVEFEEIALSGREPGSSLWQRAVESFQRNKICLKGILHTDRNLAAKESLNVALRKKFNVFASVSIAKTMFPSGRHPNVDIVVIRENTEGEYSGLHHEPFPGVVESLKVVTQRKSEAIVKFAFDYAVKFGRKKISCVHKANIMKLGDGLFLETFENVAKRYQSYGIETNSLIVDNTAMQLVGKPEQFDMIVTPNLYGNIASHIGAGLVGGPGFLTGYSIGEEYAIYEPAARFVGKSLEGMGMANPITLIQSACFMLRHLELGEYADRIEKAVSLLVRGNSEFQQDKFSSAKFTDMLLEVLSRCESSKSEI